MIKKPCIAIRSKIIIRQINDYIVEKHLVARTSKEEGQLEKGSIRKSFMSGPELQITSNFYVIIEK